MKQSNADHSRISRRAMLGAAAAMAASPALAEDCRIGPVPHHKGPLVFMDYDQVELDAPYDQVNYEPTIRRVSQRLASNSEAVRARLGAPQRVAYGPSEIEKLDVYRSKAANAPVFVFIHGGNWQLGAAKDYAYPAEMFVAAGAHYVVLDFTNVNEAGGDLGVMAAQVRRGIAWVCKNAASFGGDPSRIYIGGHSSGGHLCGVALITDWQKEFELPADAIKGGLCMSGMYEDDAGAAVMAPHLREIHRRHGGGDERAAPHRQAQRADRRHLRHVRDPRLPAPEPRLRRRGESRRQAGAADQSAEPRASGNVRVARQSLRPERPRRTRHDETDAGVSGRCGAGTRAAPARSVTARSAPCRRS